VPAWRGHCGGIGLHDLGRHKKDSVTCDQDLRLAW